MCIHCGSHGTAISMRKNTAFVAVTLVIYRLILNSLHTAQMYQRPRSRLLISGQTISLNIAYN